MPGIDLPIPKEAKPHEVAIIFFYAQYRSTVKVAEFLHYEEPSPVRRVLSKYRKFLREG